MNTYLTIKRAMIVLLVVILPFPASIAWAQPQPSGPADAKKGEQICCNNLPAHTLNMTTAIRAICAPALTQDPTVAARLDELVEGFEKAFPIHPVAGKACTNGGVQEIPQFNKPGTRKPREGCVLVSDVYAMALPLLIAVGDICHPRPPPPPVVNPSTCACVNCCSSDAATPVVELLVPLRDQTFNIFVAPEPQIASHTFAGLSPLQITRPGVQQLAGASTPLVFSPSGASGGAGVSVSPARIAQMKEIEQKAQLAAAVREVVAQHFAKQVLLALSRKGEPPADNPSEGKPPLAGISEDSNSASNGVPVTSEPGIRYLANCVPDALTVLRSVSLPSRSPDLTTIQKELASAIGTTDCLDLVRAAWPSVDGAALSDLYQKLGIESVSRLLSGAFLDDFGSWEKMVARSVTLSLSGASPSTAGVTNTFGPARAFTAAISLDLADTRDGLHSDKVRTCVKNRIARLQSATYSEGRALLSNSCLDAVGGYFGAGLESSVRYRLPEDPAASLNDRPEVEWDGIGLWLSGELAAGPTATTFYAQSGLQLDRNLDPIWRGFSTGARFTIGGEFGSLSLEALGGNYVSTADLVTTARPSARFGGEGGAQAAVALPYGLSLTAGGSFRCLLEIPCEGRFVAGFGWLAEPNLRKLITVASGRLFKE